jgi:hypothetical protein
MYILCDFVCYDLFHILLSCDKIMDPWNVYMYVCMYVPSNEYKLHIAAKSRSQWPRGLRSGHSATRLLGLRVRILPGHGCLPVASIVSCKVQFPASGWSPVQKNPNECGVCKWCGRGISAMRRIWPTRGCCAMKDNKMLLKTFSN